MDLLYDSLDWGELSEAQATIVAEQLAKESTRSERQSTVSARSRSGTMWSTASGASFTTMGSPAGVGGTGWKMEDGRWKVQDPVDSSSRERQASGVQRMVSHALSLDRMSSGSIRNGPVSENGPVVALETTQNASFSSSARDGGPAPSFQQPGGASLRNGPDALGINSDSHKEWATVESGPTLKLAEQAQASQAPNVKRSPVRGSLDNEKAAAEAQVLTTSSSQPRVERIYTQEAQFQLAKDLQSSNPHPAEVAQPAQASVEENATYASAAKSQGGVAQGDVVQEKSSEQVASALQSLHSQQLQRESSVQTAADHSQTMQQLQSIETRIQQLQTLQHRPLALLTESQNQSEQLLDPLKSELNSEPPQTLQQLQHSAKPQTESSHIVAVKGDLETRPIAKSEMQHQGDRLDSLQLKVTEKVDDMTHSRQPAHMSQSSQRFPAGTNTTEQIRNSGIHLAAVVALHQSVDAHHQHSVDRLPLQPQRQYPSQMGRDDSETGGMRHSAASTLNSALTHLADHRAHNGFSFDQPQTFSSPQLQSSARSSNVTEGPATERAQPSNVLMTSRENTQAPGETSFGVDSDIRTPIFESRQVSRTSPFRPAFRPSDEQWPRKEGESDARSQVIQELPAEQVAAPSGRRNPDVWRVLPVEQWGPLDVAAWAGEVLGLASAVQAILVREEIRGPVLLSLTEPDLERMGVVPFGRRRQLMLGIQSLRTLTKGPSENQNEIHTPCMHSPRTHASASSPREGSQSPGRATAPGSPGLLRAHSGRIIGSYTPHVVRQQSVPIRRQRPVSPVVSTMPGSPIPVRQRSAPVLPDAKPVMTSLTRVMSGCSIAVPAAPVAVPTTPVLLAATSVVRSHSPPPSCVPEAVPTVVVPRRDASPGRFVHSSPKVVVRRTASPRPHAAVPQRVLATTTELASANRSTLLWPRSFVGLPQ